METEITTIPPLSPAQVSLVDMHSLCNVLNVLVGGLVQLSLHLSDNIDLLHDSMASCQRFREELTNPASALAFARSVRKEEAAVFAEIDRHLALRPGACLDSEVLAALTNLHSVFDVLEIRAREILLRAGEPCKWLPFAISDLQADLATTMKAVALNSKGRYDILIGGTRTRPTDYVVNLYFTSVNGDEIAMPMVFKDVMRDLIANARKYTPPGGDIVVMLEQSDTELSLVVYDSGVGIPPDEIERVVHYGARGSNVQAQRTMGGGFGLTKAFLVTKSLGGRLWIESELNKGTRVLIVLPRPVMAT